MTSVTSQPPSTSVPNTTTTEAGRSCSGNLAGQIAATDGAEQLITVEATGYGSTYATLIAWQKSGSSCWAEALGPFTARVGRTGVIAPADKSEGDGHTPEGTYGFGPYIYGNAPDPGVHFAYVRLACGDWWDEDPASADYNLFEQVKCGVTPTFAQGREGSGSEALWTETVPYPSFAYIEYNADRVPGEGSAIFLAATTGYPTVGCVAIDASALDEVLDWMSPGQAPRIVIGTAQDIRSY